MAGTGGRCGGAGMLLLACVAAVPAIAALAVFGVIRTPDTPGYVAFAAQLRAGLPSGAALLAEGPAPISLFRTPGYPAVLAALQWLSPRHWALALVFIQIAAQAALAPLAYSTARRLGVGRDAALVAALLPALGFSVVVQIAILTDALYAALATAAALMLVQGRMASAAAAGLMLGAATLLREATPFLVLFYLPLAWLAIPGARPRRALAALLVLVGPCAAAGGLMAWNAARIGRPLLTTSRQTVMVQAVLPLLKRHLPVYAGSDDFDRIARATVGTGEYGEIDAMHEDLFAKAHMDAPAIADAATRRYMRAWRRFPLPMLVATMQNFRHEFLAMPFQPVDTIGALIVYAGWQRPVFDRLNLLWTALRHGSATAGLDILADVATRLCGTCIALAAIAAPWLCRNNPAYPVLFGLWLVCAGFFAVYLPVHIEPRYLVPIVPLACVLAVGCLWDNRWRARTVSGTARAPNGARGSEW